MGLFGKREKKTCAICGKELGLFGKTRLEDGYLCKDCAGKLSPFFEGARRSTVEQIRQQLAYRERNKELARQFSPTRELGGTWRVLIDDAKRSLIITNQDDWQSANPDVIAFGDVRGCDVRIDESRRELYREDDGGHHQSYNPPRYEYSYDFWVTVRVSNPYFGTIKFKLNDWPVDRRPSAEYDHYEHEAYEIRSALTSLNASPQQPYQQQGGYQPAGSPQTALQVACAQQDVTQTATPAFCPNCGAPVTPGARFCESCGSRLS